MKELEELLDERPYGIFVDNVVYDFLCKGQIIQGDHDLEGVVYVGDENGKDANILWTQKDFEKHCTTCSKSKDCIQDQQKAIIELFETGKLEGRI